MERSICDFSNWMIKLIHYIQMPAKYQYIAKVIDKDGFRDQSYIL